MTKKEIAKILRDYHWMINEITRQRKLMLDVNQQITGQYGIDGSMPHAKGSTSDPVAREAIRRIKKSKWVEKLEWQVLFVQERIYLITDERQKAVLECLLDGMSIRAISRHMGFSERYIYSIRDDIVDRIADNAGFADFADNAEKLPGKKSAC